MIADDRGYDDIIEGIVTPPDEKEDLEIADEDLKKSWGRLERRWNPKTREDKVQFYTKFLQYKLENVKQRPMDWLAFMEKKRNELANTWHIMDDETFITHLLNSLPQAEYKGAILVIKERLRGRS